MGRKLPIDGQKTDWLAGGCESRDVFLVIIDKCILSTQNLAIYCFCDQPTSVFGVRCMSLTLFLAAVSDPTAVTVWLASDRGNICASVVNIYCDKSMDKFSSSSNNR